MNESKGFLEHSNKPGLIPFPTNQCLSQVLAEIVSGWSRWDSLPSPMTNQSSSPIKRPKNLILCSYVQECNYPTAKTYSKTCEPDLISNVVW